jgi:hypothetical protein
VVTAMDVNEEEIFDLDSCRVFMGFENHEYHTYD